MSSLPIDQLGRFVLLSRFNSWAAGPGEQRSPSSNHDSLLGRDVLLAVVPKY